MLEWYVYVYDFNGNDFIAYNIFHHAGFMTKLKEIAEQYGGSRIRFADHVTNALRYYFWGKTEWEIILSSWPPSDKCKPRKISVFDQIMLNWERFNKYLFDNKHLLLCDNDIPMDNL